MSGARLATPHAVGLASVLVRLASVPVRLASMLARPRENLRAWRVVVVPMLASALAACNTPSTPTATVSDDTLKITGFGYLAPGRNQAVVNLRSKSNSNVYGTITFREKDGKTSIAATVWNLSIGPHSIYIHENGNCSSPNAASAGPVWNVAPPGQKRSGQLPELQVGTEGNAYMQAFIGGLSIGDKKPTDIVGRAVVVHATVVEDPKPQFGGVPNGWVACGIIEQGGG